MKRGIRLTALLLAMLLLFQSAAFAMEQTGGFPIEALDNGSYAAMLAGAQDESGVIGKKAKTNYAGVTVYDWTGTFDKDTIEAEGTVVEIIGIGILGWKYQVRYTKNGEERTGYIYKAELTIIYEIVSEPWDESQPTATLSFEADGAASYVWERGIIHEDGSVTWEAEPVATGAELTLETDIYGDFSALKYTYRCVAKNEAGETVGTSEKTTLVREDIAAWMATENVCWTMLVRAMDAPTLDSMVFEGNWMRYVRTGERFAYLNRETNVLTSAENGSVIGYVIGDTVYLPRK